jgi:hypothetical protein
MYENGEGVEQDLSKAIELYEKACEGSYAPGYSSLGLMYENGRGVEQDLSKAFELYEKACELGDTFGCYKL